jgi:phosphoribosylanthranilate isomerase
LENFTKLFEQKNWFLAGGINLENIAKAISIANATMVDISSGIEEIRGTKSNALIKKFMQTARNLC